MKTKNIADVVLVALLLQVYGCIPTTVRDNDKRYERTEAVYFVSLQTVQLLGVEPQLSGSINNRIAADNMSTAEYQDNYVKTTWNYDSKRVGNEQLRFHLENKTDSLVKLLWDDAAYVDPFEVTHKVTHSGVRGLDIQRPQSPSLILGKSRISDVIVPTDYVTFVSGEWRARGLFLPWLFLNSNQEKDFEKFKQEVNAYKGRSFRVLLPLLFAQNSRNHVFTFTIDSIRFNIQRTPPSFD